MECGGHVPPLPDRGGSAGVRSFAPHLNVERGGGLASALHVQSRRVFRILILAVALLAALVPFVPAIVFFATLTLSIVVATVPLVRAKTRCDDQPVALLALVSFRAPPAFV